jgi:hypothetical protein
MEEMETIQNGEDPNSALFLELSCPETNSIYIIKM